MADKIFINYRRDDMIGTTGRLHDRLTQTFGLQNIFNDRGPVIRLVLSRFLRAGVQFPMRKQRSANIGVDIRFGSSQRRPTFCSTFCSELYRLLATGPGAPGLRIAHV